MGPTTLALYKASAARFTIWATQHRCAPSSAEEWDDLLIEFKNDPEIAETGLSRAQFSYLVAAVEFFFPRMKGGLRWSRAALAGWHVALPTHHTVPLGKKAAKLLGVHMCFRGRPRMGLALILQAHTGLRPGELLAMKPEHVAMPEAGGSSLMDRPMLIALGPKSGTKLKRPQVARLTFRDADIVDMIRELLRHATPNEPLFPFCLVTYRNAIRALDCFLGFAAGWSAHSPRAGFASDSIAEGVPFDEVRELGRWSVDSSLRVYLDHVSTAATLVTARTAGLGPALQWVALHWQVYFRGARW